MRFRFLLVLVLLNTIVHAQVGHIRGTVFDSNTGEFLPGVTVFAEGTTTGTITDLDGNFNLSLEPGSYDLRISFISYETILLQGIEVVPDEVNVLDELGMQTANIDIEEVVITAQSIKNTENAMISLKRKSPNVMDGISAASFRKIGDSDAAASMKRVSGVSVTGGKYVFVRGLGDRYTKTILNGVDIPGLDPDRNTIQMDLFPTSIIDNIKVHKSFSANLPADFTGGVVDIAIKDFPTSKKSKISIGTGYNPNFHFNSNYLTYEGSTTDILGFDDGLRKIPASNNIPEFAYALADPDGPTGLRYKEILNSFNPIMAAMNKTSFMDVSLGASYGNQVQKGRRTIGYILALSYKNNTEFYQNAIDARYGMDARPDFYELDVREYQEGSFGVNSVFLSALAGYAVKSHYSRIRTYLIHLQNGESKAGIFDFTGSDQGSNFTALQQTLDYSQRSLTNLFIDGKHILDETGWELVWKVSPTLSLLYDPDVRQSRYKSDDGNVEIGTEVGFPERIWRNLIEINLANTFHATKDYEFLNRKAVLKMGGAYTLKFRNYKIQTFKLNIRGGDTGFVPLTGDPNELLTEDLKWPYNGNLNFGTTFENDLNPANSYDATVNYGAMYVSTDLNLLDNLKSSVGLRVEKYYQQYTGQNQDGSKVLDNDEVLNDLNLFPSVNLIYNVTERQNLRFSFSQTIARPSLKELSFAEIYDPLSGRTFVGGLHTDADPVNQVIYWDGNLESTDIQNYDMRWEFFSAYGQLISLSGFYKSFRNPIEMVQFATMPTAYQPRNVGDGEVYGGEFEIRQSMSFLSKSLAPVSFNSNVTINQSRIRLSNIEKSSREENKRTGQVIGDYRVMAGQAPYIINAGLAFNGSDEEGFWQNFETGIYYNVQGTTLQYVGIADRPDIYSLPFHSLNFNTNLAFGKEDRISMNIKISNLLGEDKEMVFKSFEAKQQYFEYRDPGRSFSVSLGYTFH